MTKIFPKYCKKKRKIINLLMIQPMTLCCWFNLKLLALVCNFLGIPLVSQHVLYNLIFKLNKEKTQKNIFSFSSVFISSEIVLSYHAIT